MLSSTVLYHLSLYSHDLSRPCPGPVCHIIGAVGTASVGGGGLVLVTPTEDIHLCYTALHAGNAALIRCV